MTQARWENGHTEWRVTLAEPSEDYLKWVRMMKGEYDDENNEYEYDYDVGIAP